MKKLLSIGMILLAFSGCAIFRSTMPDYVRYNIGQNDSSDWMQGNMDHPTVWAENIHRMMLNSSIQPITHSHWALDGAVHGARDVAAELATLEKEGAKFRVTTRAGGKFAFQILKPASPTDAVTGVLGKLIPFSSKEDYVAMMLNNVGRGAKQLSNDSIPKIEELYFSTVTEIGEIKAGKELSFQLPDGITRENYADLLDCILVAYHTDYEEVMNYQAALASSLAAVASLDSASKGSINNLYLVLGAALEDRERFAQERKTNEQYPQSPEAMAEVKKKAALIYSATAESARYKAWVQEPHAINKLLDFGSATVDAFSSLSEVYGAMGGVDIVGNVQDKLAQGVSVTDMLNVGLKLVPSGSKLESVIKTGKDVHSAAEHVTAAAADPSAAGGKAASGLLVWAAPEEVEKAKRLVTSLPQSKQ